MNRIFARLAGFASWYIGTPSAFIIATLLCLVWAVSGPLFAYSNTWQLVINTATTVLTFLILFLLQYTQNRDSIAVQLKLDELLHAIDAANSDLAGIEKDVDGIEKKVDN
jgi:low affinity Fe/Cu permease